MHIHKIDPARLLLLAPLILAGCSAAEFSAPVGFVVPQGHDSFDGLDYLSMEVRYDDGRSWDLFLESPEPGVWEVPNLPAGEALSLRFVGLVGDGLGGDGQVEVSSGGVGPIAFLPDVPAAESRVLFTRRGRTGALAEALDSSRVDPILASLGDGGLLVLGGAEPGDEGAALDSAARFAVDGGADAYRFLPVAPMRGARSGGAAVTVQGGPRDGQVVVMGTVPLVSDRTGDILVDYSDTALQDAREVGIPEVFDPADGSWSDLGDDDVLFPFAARGHLGMAQLGESIAVAGGISFDDVGGIGLSASGELLLVPLDGGETVLADLMLEARWRHTLTAVDGRLVAIGGAAVPTSSTTFPENTLVEVYDPEEDSWSAVGDLEPGRADHVAVPLPDGRILVAGGVGALDTEVLGDAWLVDVDAGTFTPTAPMPTPRVRASAVALSDGRVVVCGGEREDFAVATGCDVFALGPGGGAWAPAPDPAASWDASFGNASALLGSGEVVITGGERTDGSGVREVLVYRP